MAHNTFYYVVWIENGEHKKLQLCGMEACMNYICDVLKPKGTCSQFQIAKTETYDFGV